VENYNPGSTEDRQLLASELVRMLEVAGFLFQDRGNPWTEELSATRVIHTRMKIMIYTTITGGPRVGSRVTPDNLEVRRNGQDAIRIAVVSMGGTPRGLLKLTRINRTGTREAITARTLDRLRDAWTQAREIPICSCGAPKFIAKSGAPTCSDLCWLGGK